MTYEETILIIKKFLESSETLQTFGGHTENFNNITCMIEEHIEKSSNSDTIIATQEQIDKVKDSLSTIKIFLLEIPITSGVKDFITAYTDLIFNWANNCVYCDKAAELTTDVNFIGRFVQYHLSCTEVLALLPQFFQKLNSLNNISLPSIELARHYLGSLEKPKEE